MQPSHIHDHITQAVDEHISKRPRRSYPKACQPCRRRKIRCDTAQPCSHCTWHDYPELCFYTVTGDERKVLRQRRRHKYAANGEASEQLQAPAGRLTRLLEFEKGLQTLEDLASTEPGPPVEPEQHPRPYSDSTRQSYNSVTLVPATLSLTAESIRSGKDCTKNQHPGDRHVRIPAARDVLYMIDTGDIHPFESLWQPGSTVHEISLALPNDEIFTR